MTEDVTVTQADAKLIRDTLQALRNMVIAPSTPMRMQVQDALTAVDRLASEAPYKEEIERLREIVVSYCDRVPMANAPPHLQQTIDDAFARTELKGKPHG